MRRTSTVCPYRSYLTLLAGLCLLLTSGISRAQTIPASEGQVADSTELRALRQFYYATGGPQWSDHTNWLSGSTLAEAASWRGVQVEAGDVTVLAQFNNHLIDSLPTSLGLLTGLRTLDLRANALTGALPETLGQLRQLQLLWVANNQFTGSLPATLGQLTQLQYLSAEGNRFTGELPAALGRCTQLYFLTAGDNLFRGAIPTRWGQLTNLQYLLLARNLLDKALPDALTQLTALRMLDVSANLLPDSLPRQWGALHQLFSLDLNTNRLVGTLPASLGRLRGLNTLDVSNNQLRGRLPDSLSQSVNLRYLRLGHNHLQGPLPAAWGQLPLYYLIADHNDLSGPIPRSWQGMTQLGELNLGYNQLTGTVPDSLRAAYLLLNDNALDSLSAGYAYHRWNVQLLVGNNHLHRLPGFLGLADLNYLTLWAGGNYLDFASLEANWQPAQRGTPAPGWSFSTNGMLTPAGDTLIRQAGETVELDGRIGGANNHYQWQRLVGEQWVNMPGQTAPKLRLAALTVAETGTYRTQVSNDWILWTVLYAPSHYLDIVPYRPLAQNRPDDKNQGLTPAPLLPADSAAWHSAAAPADMNYVRVWTPRVALIDATRVPTDPIDSVSMSTQYLDGLGRPVQTVLKQASPARRDMVQPQAYDGLGRETRAYLPYADKKNGDGGYRPQALRQQDAFYRPSLLPNPPTADDSTRGVARTGAAYAESLFEASPLGRVVAQGAAGEAWQVTAGHVVERTERPNTAADSVLWFTPGYDPKSLDPGYRGYYAADELWGTDVSDAHGPNEVGAKGYRTIEWKDKLGQVVCKQVEANRVGTGSSQHSRWLRTAYAYDDFGHLRFVLQPEGTKRVLVLGNVPAAVPASVQSFLFHYRYDGRGRQIAKQVPGQYGETLVVYDQLDRPVLSQDAAQRTRKEWSWTKYDALGRIILSGLVTRGDTLGQVSLQAIATADTTTTHQYEQRTADKTRYPQFYTTAQSFPQLGQGNLLSDQGFGAGQVLSVTRYDDYDYNLDGQADVAYDASTDGQFPSGKAPVADALRTTGLVTQTKTRVLGIAESDDKQAAWLTTTTFYDERARPVQVQTTNARIYEDYQQGRDLLTTRLDFTGKVVQSVAVHRGPSLAVPLQVTEFFTYDHTGRLLTTSQQLPGETQPVLLASVKYNEIGQAVRKTLGTGRLQQDVDYAYNIRGWLTSLNDPYQPNKDDLFNLSLHYERGFTKGYEQYNGNLMGQTWRGRDGVQRAYGYVYDPLNRLLQGDFVARTTTSPLTPMAGAWKAEEDNYRLAFVSYDDNGNILKLRRRGLLHNATHASSKQYGAVDNLTYVYQGNRLQAVDDAVTGNQLSRPKNYNGAPTSLAGDFQEQGVKLGEEYLYDANGNLTQDKNKGITGILYNHLNLPRQIHFGSVGDSIVFRYTASGQKVTKLVYQTGKPMPLRTDYLGPYQYEQDSLKFFPHAEGRVLRFVSYDAANQPKVSYQREFTFKDHLGNLRLAYRLGQARTYLASLEQDDNTRKRETQQFDSLSVSVPIAVATPWAMGQYAARLNAGGTNRQPLGPLTQLTVQKGDSLQVSAPGLYPEKVNNPSFAFSLASFVAGLLQPAPAGTPPSADGSRRGGLPLLQVGLNAATLTAVSQLSNGVPKGYLRVLVFNQDSVLVDQRKLQLSTNALSHYEVLHDTLTIRQNGYVTVYVGNESAADVYFDELRIEHRQGLQVQENQYDPYGLSLAGVSEVAPGLRLKNFYQFNGKENQIDLGLNWNHHDWRFFDYQLGRWHGTDPMIEDGQEQWSPYVFGNDNAVRFSDPDGQFPPLLISGAVGAVVGAVVGAGIEAGTQMYKNGGHVSDWNAVGGAGLQGGVTGGMAGLTAGTSLLRSGAVGAVSNIAGGIARNVYDGKPVTVGSVAKDAAIGAASAMAGHAAGKLVNAIRFASPSKVLGLTVGELQRLNVGNQAKLGQISAKEASKLLEKGGAGITNGLKDQTTGKVVKLAQAGGEHFSVTVESRVKDKIISTVESKVPANGSGIKNIQQLVDKGPPYNRHFLGATK